MANFIYAKALQFYPFPNIVGNTIRVSLIRMNDGYLPDPLNDEFYNAIPPAAIKAVSDPLTNKSFVGGVFKADDITFGAVPSGQACDGLVIWHDTGNNSNSRLLVWIDEYSGLPVTPDGVNWINVQWPASGIFAI